MLGGDLSVFMNGAHFATTVVMGAVSGMGILDAPGVNFDGVLSEEHLLTCETSKFGSARYGDQIAVGGVAYTVRQCRPIDDGAFCEILLTKV